MPALALYIPAREADFTNFLAQFATLTSANPPDYGLRPLSTRRTAGVGFVLHCTRLRATTWPNFGLLDSRPAHGDDPSSGIAMEFHDFPTTRRCGRTCTFQMPRKAP